MKQFMLLTLVLLFSKVNAQTVSLRVEIVGYKSNMGKAYVAIYNSEKNFLKKPLLGKIEKIENNKAIVIFKDLIPGESAISSYHDENSNGKLDTNFVGIPKEDYAMSNNAEGFMSAPKYQDAKFTINQNKTISIKN